MIRDFFVWAFINKLGWNKIGWTSFHSVTHSVRVWTVKRRNQFISTIITTKLLSFFKLFLLIACGFAIVFLFHVPEPVSTCTNHVKPPCFQVMKKPPCFWSTSVWFWYRSYSTALHPSPCFNLLFCYCLLSTLKFAFGVLKLWNGCSFEKIYALFFLN